MKTRKKILILAVVIAVAAVALIAQTPARSPRGPMAQFLGQHGDFGGGGMAAHHWLRGRLGHEIGGVLVAEYLELTDAQKAVIEEAKKAAREELRDDVIALRDGHQAIREAVKSGQSVDALADQQGDRVASLIKEVAAKLSDAKAKLNLTPQQEAKIEKLHERVEERMGSFWERFGEAAPVGP